MQNLKARCAFDILRDESSSQNDVLKNPLPVETPGVPLEHRRIVAGIPNTLPPQDFTGMLSLAASDVCAGRAEARTVLGRPCTKLAFITCWQGQVKLGK